MSTKLARNREKNYPYLILISHILLSGLTIALTGGEWRSVFAQTSLDASPLNRLDKDKPTENLPQIPVTPSPLLEKDKPNAEIQSLEENENLDFPFDANFTTLIVGIDINQRPAIDGALVRGREDGTNAINLSDWLVPFDVVREALNLEITPLEEDILEVRSRQIVTRIDRDRLQSDPELGQVFSVAQIEEFFGITVEFDLENYSLNFKIPRLAQNFRPRVEPPPVQIEGLEKIKPDDVTISAIEQRIDTAGVEGNSSNTRGDFAIVGTVAAGSYFFRLNQRNLSDSTTWTLTEGQYLRQSDRADYAIGSQGTFWNSGERGDFVGFTTIQRQGFTPPTYTRRGGFAPEERMQGQQVGRNIVGRADPGTLVRLVLGSSNLIDEVLVDSSGIYRFDEIPVGQNPLYRGGYRLFLYPEGQLSAQPEVRSPTFGNAAGQLEAGTSATIVSAGVRRVVGAPENGVLGEFENIAVGVGQRWGISENFTFGLGAIVDNNFRGLGEFFFSPTGTNFQIGASILTPDRNETWDIDANIYFRPIPQLFARFNSDRFSRRLNLDWRIFQGVSLLGTYDNLNGLSAGIQTSSGGNNYLSFVRATIDEDSDFRWNIIQRLGVLEFTQQGNEISSNSQLDFNLSGNPFFDWGHSLLFGYETRNLRETNELARLGWRYRSPDRARDGRYLYEFEVGYGFGTLGSGFVATAETTAIPGLLVRAIYQGISVTSDRDSYRLEILSSLNLHPRISEGDRRLDLLRTRGGIAVLPFFDNNSNGKKETGESFFSEGAEYLLILNNQSISTFRPEIANQQILLHLPPGTYRLDLDPAGYPIDWQPLKSAYAVVAVEGSYTPIYVPFVPAYSLSGIVTDSKGNPLAGATVEAFNAANGDRRFSVTNTAGVYYLEGLKEGVYRLMINNQAANPEEIIFESTSERFQELNFAIE
ncbi:carboxypeptidase-like regulatory domain-containing protein [Spirulina sp. 06S082]|uniref:carboxypeptidase-like regulatory domain-containing protein n=1 Tax=Spirulina sp. 06S082 TaxID=3110248 RepID=UPI002B219E87|nr:carboxypeptidase-like regulatory domain-containing protein [Spirulina sp. 06S082]MEA5468352.1 carboxypeptidase-like regulatory domain-containing protein [Spirulina sp. 06S082]